MTHVEYHFYTKYAKLVKICNMHLQWIINSNVNIILHRKPSQLRPGVDWVLSECILWMSNTYLKKRLHEFEVDLTHTSRRIQHEHHISCLVTTWGHKSSLTLWCVHGHGLMEFTVEVQFSGPELNSKTTKGGIISKINLPTRFLYAFIDKSVMWFLMDGLTPLVFKNLCHQNVVFFSIFQKRLAMFMEDNLTLKRNVKGMSI